MRTNQQQQEEFFQLQKQEERVYTELIETSDPAERTFFKNRGENSLVLAKKAQEHLREQENSLKQHKKDLDKQEQEAEIQYRQDLAKREEA